MVKIFLVLMLFWPAVAAAAIVNMEFKFTPYIGDPATSDQVDTVPGNAKVFINNVLFAEQEVRADKALVLFDEREISPSVWVTASSLGAALRKGKNSIKIEFMPTKADEPYSARLCWVTVMDQSTEKIEGGRFEATNQSGAGQEDKKAKGAVVFEREFVAEFAVDLPWHHYAAVTSITEEDKKSLALLVTKRTEAFKPKFEGVYEILKQNPNVTLKELKKAKCLDKAYAAGVRIVPPEQDQLDFVMTGNPEVVVNRKGAASLFPFDEKSFAKIKGDELQMCVAMALSVVYPPRLMVVRTPSGAWEVVY